MTLKKLIEEKFTDGKIQFIVIILTTAISVIFAYWRTSESNGSKFIKDQLTRCESRLEICEKDRFNDIENCNKRLDTMLIKLIELKIELENLKTGI